MVQASSVPGLLRDAASQVQSNTRGICPRWLPGCDDRGGDIWWIDFHLWFIQHPRVRWVSRDLHDAYLAVVEGRACGVWFHREGAL